MTSQGVNYTRGITVERVSFDGNGDLYAKYKLKNRVQSGDRRGGGDHRRRRRRGWIEVCPVSRYAGGVWG